MTFNLATNVLDLYFGQLNKGPYTLKTGTGQTEAIVTEVQAGDYYLTWYQSDLNELMSGFDVHNVQQFDGEDWLCVVGGYTVRRASPLMPWVYMSKQEYVGPNGMVGFPVFPLQMDDGTVGSIENSGTWNWVQYDATGTKTVSAGSGSYGDLSTWNLFAGRFSWEEDYKEYHLVTGQVASDRIAFYDSTGMLGFISKDRRETTCWRAQ